MINILNRTILTMLGCDIDQNGNIVDQETMQSVCWRGKKLKYPGSNDSVIVHKYDVIFDPLSNRRLTEDLFKIFLAKEQEFEGLYTILYFSEMKNDKVKIIINTNKGDFESSFFYNISLSYIDLMASLSNITINELASYDFTCKPEPVRSIKSRR